MALHVPSEGDSVRSSFGRKQSYPLVHRKARLVRDKKPAKIPDKTLDARVLAFLATASRPQTVCQIYTYGSGIYGSDIGRHVYDSLRRLMRAGDVIQTTEKHPHIYGSPATRIFLVYQLAPAKGGEG